MNITAKELARQLGVSQSAVSIALNGKPGISDKTRATILAAAIEEGYCAEESPAILQKPKKTICYMIFVDENTANVADHSTFSTFVFQGIDAAAAQLGYKTLIRYCYADSLLLQQMADVLQHVDGIILLATNYLAQHTESIERFLQEISHIPIVAVDSFALCHQLDCVGNDCFGGGQLVAQHLLQLGHTSIGYIRFRQRLSAFQERENGLRAGLSAEGLSFASVVDVDISSDGAFYDFDAWLSTNPALPTAFFAENDVIAAAALRALKKHGIQVPQEIVLVGFDNVAISELVDPPLTTIHSHKEQLGALAMNILHQRMTQTSHKSDDGLVRASLSMSLVVRESTAPSAL